MNDNSVRIPRHVLFIYVAVVAWAIAASVYAININKARAGAETSVACLREENGTLKRETVRLHLMLAFEQARYVADINPTTDKVMGYHLELRSDHSSIFKAVTNISADNGAVPFHADALHIGLNDQGVWSVEAMPEMVKHRHTLEVMYKTGNTTEAGNEETHILYFLLVAPKDATTPGASDLHYFWSNATP